MRVAHQLVDFVVRRLSRPSREQRAGSPVRRRAPPRRWPVPARAAAGCFSRRRCPPEADRAGGAVARQLPAADHSARRVVALFGFFLRLVVQPHRDVGAHAILADHRLEQRDDPQGHVLLEPLLALGLSRVGVLFAIGDRPDQRAPVAVDEDDMVRREALDAGGDQALDGAGGGRRQGPVVLQLEHDRRFRRLFLGAEQRLLRHRDVDAGAGDFAEIEPIVRATSPSSARR